MGVPAEKAVVLYVSIRLCVQRGNLLKILLNNLAKPGFSLQSLTQLELQ